MRAVATLVLSTLLVGCQPQPELMATYWQNWGNTQLGLWIESSEALSSEVSSYCAESSDLTQLQAQWRDTFLRWSSINGLPYKGVADLTLEFELYFWPDKRNRIEGQLRQRLVQGDIASPELLETRIAAEKGLAALEWLVFSADTDRNSRCSLLPGTAEDYRNKVAQVAAYHQQNPIVQEDWLAADSAAQSNSISLNLLFSQITALKTRLSNSLNEESDWLANGAYGWRSNSTLTSFSASLGSVLTHLQYLTTRPELAPDTEERLAELLPQGTNLLQRMELGESPVEELSTWLEQLETLLHNGISRDFDVLIGFNNFDGD